MNRRKFLHLFGCGCLSIGLHSCATAPITERKQLKLIPEYKLNAQAKAIYEEIKKKEKMSDDEASLNQIKKIGNDEMELKAKIEKFKGDEINHNNIAYEAGATNKGLYSIMDKVIKTGSRIAIAISEKI